VTLRDYLLIVARSWIVVVVAVAAGLVTAGVLVLTTTATYTASAQVLFTGHATTSGQDLAYVGNYVQSRMQTYKNLGKSTDLLESVAGAIKSKETPKELAERTEIEVSQISTVATVSATDTSAKGAALTANTLAAAMLNAVQKLEADNAADPKANTSDKPAKATIQGVVTGRAEAPTSPSDPDIPFYLVSGVLAGLLVSVGVIALREVLRGETSASRAGEDP
jgi:capsular polysaccharide biosynthesis protein